MRDFIEKNMSRFKTSHIFDKQNKYTYKQILELTVLHGSKLMSVLPAEAKCAILCDSGVHTVIALLSCWYAKMIPIPMSKHYGEAHCGAIVELTKPNIILTDNEENQSFCGYAYDIYKQCFIGNIPIIQDEPELNDVSLIMCTSGTTGKPKGTMITTEGLRKNVRAIANYFRLTDGDTILIARPLYHCAVLTGEFLIALYSGANIMFFDDKYNPNSVLQAAVKHKVSVLCGTPTLINHLSRFIQRNNIQHGVRKIAISGECLSKMIAVNIRRGFPDTEIYHVYGLTEASPRVSYLSAEKFDEIPESSGNPLNGIQIKIIDDAQNELPANSHGQVIVKTPCVMKGYYHNEEATQKAIRGDWLYTGDIGYKDENGYLYIVSRADDMIIKGGINIYPKEIENRVLKIKEVSECTSYGVKLDAGQGIALDVVLNDEAKPTSKKELMSLLSNVLPAYQMPSELNVVDFIRRNASGKFVRNSYNRS